jgi:hypothetical protein
VAKSKYIRFTVEPREGKRVAEDGIFVAAYALSRGDELTPTARDQLIDLLTWFSSNLAAPRRFSRSDGKGWRRQEGIDSGDAGELDIEELKREARRYREVVAADPRPNE